MNTGVKLYDFMDAFNQVMASLIPEGETRPLLLNIPPMSDDTIVVSKYGNGFNSYHYIYEHLSVSIVADGDDNVWGSTVVGQGYFTGTDETTPGAIYLIMIAETSALTGFFGFEKACDYDDILNEVKNVEGPDGIFIKNNFWMSRSESALPSKRMTVILHKDYPAE